MGQTVNKNTSLKKKFIYVLEITIDELSQEDKKQLLAIQNRSNSVQADFSEYIIPKLEEKNAKYTVVNIRPSTMLYENLTDRQKRHSSKFKGNIFPKNKSTKILDITTRPSIYSELVNKKVKSCTFYIRLYHN